MDLKKRLYDVLLKEPKSFRALSKEMGVHEQVLARFLERNKKIQFSTGLKMESWIQKKEKELGL